MWAEQQRPGQTAKGLPIITSSATTPLGALRDIWCVICEARQAEAAPVMVLLLPDVLWLRRCVVRSPNSMAKRGDHFMSWRLELKPAGLVAVVGVLCGNDLDR